MVPGPAGGKDNACIHSYAAGHFRLHGTLHLHVPALSTSKHTSCMPNIVLDRPACHDTRRLPSSPLADAAEERPQEAAPGADGVSGEVRVWGNLVAFVERLDDEMFKSLQVRQALG